MAEVLGLLRGEIPFNVRAALEWCFGENGNVPAGIGLAAAAAPVFLTMSLLIECHRWSERAIRALDIITLLKAAPLLALAAHGLGVRAHLQRQDLGGAIGIVLQHLHRAG